ncbi:hypothetical protein ACTWQF_06135 [Streptomyces sp. 8N114]|uniref:hypothetical protein n=1 Tax=Streptomyces sp. 8N114 TaxID=3457419 RepID=UPI003FD532F3
MPFPQSATDTSTSPSDGPSLITAVDRKERKVGWTSVGKDDEEAPTLLAHRRSGQLVVATGSRVFGLPLK